MIHLSPQYRYALLSFIHSVDLPSRKTANQKSPKDECIVYNDTISVAEFQYQSIKLSICIICMFGVLEIEILSGGQKLKNHILNKIRPVSYTGAPPPRDHYQWKER